MSFEQDNEKLLEANDHGSARKLADFSTYVSCAVVCAIFVLDIYMYVLFVGNHPQFPKQAESKHVKMYPKYSKLDIMTSYALAGCIFLSLLLWWGVYLLLFLWRVIANSELCRKSCVFLFTFNLVQALFGMSAVAMWQFTQCFDAKDQLEAFNGKVPEDPQLAFRVKMLGVVRPVSFGALFASLFLCAANVLLSVFEGGVKDGGAEDGADDERSASDTLSSKASPT